MRKQLLLLSACVACLVYARRRRNRRKGDAKSNAAVARLLKYITRVEALQMGFGIASGILYSWTTLDLTADVETVLDPSEARATAGNLSNLSTRFMLHALRSEVFNFLYLYPLKCAGQRLVFRLRRDAFGALLHQEASFFDTRQTGALTTQLTEDTQKIAVLPFSIARGLQHLVFVTRGLWSLASSSNAQNEAKIHQLALELVAILIGSATLSIVARKRSAKVTKALQDTMGDLGGFADERLMAVHTVQAYSQEQRETAGFAKLARNIYGVACAKGGTEALQSCLTQSLGYIGIARILFVCGAMCSEGKLSVGALIAFVARSVLLLVGVRGLLSVSRDVGEAATASEDLFAMLDAMPQAATSSPPNTTADVFEGSVELENVTFSYPSRPSVEVWKGMSLSIPAGCKLAVVGSSGCGKTTLAKMLLKFYTPLSGRVLVNGQEIRSTDTASLRKRIGYVPQDSVLFDGTILDNILYGCGSECTEAQAVAAAQKANAHEFITALPDGYQTVVGQRGCSLSGGERQRIAIARALVRDPKILILDEALNALDGENEAQVRQAIDALVQHKGWADRMTVIAIGHRLASVCNSDKVIVIRDGTVVEQGAYATLKDDASSHFMQLMGGAAVP